MSASQAIRLADAQAEVKKLQGKLARAKKAATMWERRAAYAKEMLWTELHSQGLGPVSKNQRLDVLNAIVEAAKKEKQ